MRRTMGVVRAGSGRSGSIHSGRGRSGGSAGSRGRSFGVRASDRGGVNGEFGKFSGDLRRGGVNFLDFLPKFVPFFAFPFPFLSSSFPTFLSLLFCLK